MKKELITKIDAKSPVSEVFRSLRTNIQYMSKSSSCQTILVTSTTQGEGKSWIVSNLAVTFAQTGKNVIIIDADMRRPRQNNIFGIDMFPGLSNYLAGMSSRGTDKNIAVKDCIQATEIDNLYVLPAGNIPPNPSELLESTKTKELLNELKKIFDVVIFDGAPCLLVTDATIISRIVDSTILVASYKTTKIDELKDAKRRIEAIGGHVAGVVLNRTKLTKKKYENSYYSSSIELTTMKSDASRRRFVEKEDDEVDKDEKAQEIEEIKRYNKGRRAK